MSVLIYIGELEEMGDFKKINLSSFSSYSSSSLQSLFGLAVVVYGILFFSFRVLIQKPRASFLFPDTFNPLKEYQTHSRSLSPSSS